MFSWIKKVRIVYGISEDQLGSDEIFVYGAFTNLKLANIIIENLKRKIQKDWNNDEIINTIDFTINEVTDNYHLTMEMEKPKKN